MNRLTLLLAAMFTSWSVGQSAGQYLLPSNEYALPGEVSTNKHLKDRQLASVPKSNPAEPWWANGRRYVAEIGRWYQASKYPHKLGLPFLTTAVIRSTLLCSSDGQMDRISKMPKTLDGSYKFSSEQSAFLA